MELRQLEYFVELCRVRNFTRASQNLNVAQPSVTKAIQQLESELGVRLVERSQKPLGLTPAGERFYARVEPLLRQLEEAVDEVSAKGRAPARPINVGVSPFTGVILDRLLSAPEATGQGLYFNMIRRSSTEIMSLLMDRELDLGWLICHKLPPELEFIPIEEQEVVLILPPDSPLRFQKEITFRDLRDDPPTTMLSNRKAALSQIVMERFREAGVEIQPKAEFEQYHPDLRMAIQWVRNGLGPSFIPEHAAEDITDLPIVSVSPPLFVQVGLACRKGGNPAPGTRRLIEYIQREYPRYLHKN